MSELTSAFPASAATEASSAALSARRFALLASLGTRGGLALADQGLYAGAHFVLNVVLARWLAPAGYGAFALAYSIFLLAGAVYNALVLEPVAVFGAGRSEAERPMYFGFLLRAHVAVTLPIGGLLILGAALASFWGFSGAAATGVALGLLTPLMLLPWLTRRMFYVGLWPAGAVAGNALYCALLLTTASVLFRSDQLSASSALLAMTFAGVVTATVQIAWLRPSWTSHGVVRTRALVADHWKHGRWALASAAAMWFPLNVYYYALPVFTGLEAAGAFRALLNLANPLLHSLVALGLLLTPSLVRARDAGGVTLVAATVRRVSMLCLCASAVYLAPLWAYRDDVLALLYGSRYQGYSALPVMLVGMLPLASSVTITIGSALRALERPKQVFWSYAVFTATAASIGIPCSAFWGLSGALTGMIISYLALAVTMLVFYRQAIALPGPRQELSR